MNPLVMGWLMWLAGVVGGWGLRGVWINRKVKRMLDTATIDVEIGNLESAKRLADKAATILDVL